MAEEIPLDAYVDQPRDWLEAREKAFREQISARGGRSERQGSMKPAAQSAAADAREARECAAALRAFRARLKLRALASKDSASYAAALAAIRDFDAQARRVLRALSPRRRTPRARGNARNAAEPERK